MTFFPEVPNYEPGRIVHCKRQNFDIYIGNPGKWGNPYTVERYGRQRAIELFEEHLAGHPYLLADLPELAGKVLGCWCAPKACHGGILLKYLSITELQDDAATDRTHHPYTAYNQGHDAQAYGWPITKGPYRKGSLRAWWQSGWTDSKVQGERF